MPSPRLTSPPQEPAWGLALTRAHDLPVRDPAVAFRRSSALRCQVQMVLSVVGRAPRELPGARGLLGPLTPIEPAPPGSGGRVPEPAAPLIADQRVSPGNAHPLPSEDDHGPDAHL